MLRPPSKAKNYRRRKIVRAEQIKQNIMRARERAREVLWILMFYFYQRQFIYGTTSGIIYL